MRRRNLRCPPYRLGAQVRAAFVAVAVLAALTGCDSGQPRPGGPAPTTPAGSAATGPTGGSTATAGPGGSSPADRAACASLFARLQRVTGAISSGSELIAGSANARDLSGRIAVEQGQLERSAQLMSTGPIPAPLATADRQLVAALHAFAADFGRARAPAARGDFQGAAQAMSDPPVVQRILDAAKTIEDACRP